MSSYQQGFDTATLELMSGYPAYFYGVDDGSRICGFEDQFGLPVALAGDCVFDMAWLIGFNKGVLANIERFGLPWNSRLNFLNILKDPGSYFNPESARSRRLSVDGQIVSFDELGLALFYGEGEEGHSLYFEAQSLFHDPGVVRGAMEAYRSGPPNSAIPESPHPPSLRPGKKSVFNWYFSEDKCVEFLPGPKDSHLLVFRSSEQAPNNVQGKAIENSFAVLDTQLGTWIPGQICKPFLQYPF